jgi:cation:H+ antiporter
MAYAFVAVGMLLLFFGSELLLRGGIGLFKAAGLSPLLIGLFVVSAATSAPELSVVLQSVAVKAPEVGVADVIGSNIINLLLVLGLGALVRPLPSPPKIAFRDGGALLLASIALAVIVVLFAFTRRVGVALLCGFAIYLVVSFITDWRRSAQLSVSEARAQCRDYNHSAGVNLFLLALGAVSLFFGARCLVDGALVLAPMLHMSNAITGLTIVAFATALPEMVVVFGISRRGWDNITVGHLLASSVFNILAVLGFAAAFHPFALPHDFTHVDVYALVGVATLVLPLMITSWRLTRWNGALLVLCYGVYGAFLAWRLGYIVLPYFG